MKISYTECTDSDLWEAIKHQNDELAFAELHHRFASALYKVALRKIGNKAIAEDLIQDVFITIWLKRHQIIIKKTIQLYLFTSLKNRIINHFRVRLELITSSLSISEQTFVESYASNTTEEFVFVNDLQSQYDTYLSELPERSRVVFELSRNGLTNKEIAESLGIVEKTVEFHISKCLKILRERIEYSVILITLLNI